MWDDEGFQCGDHVAPSLGPKHLKECVTEFGIVPNMLHGCLILFLASRHILRLSLGGTEFLQPFQLRVADCWSDMVGM